MSEEWLFVYPDFCLAVYSSPKLHLHRPWFPKAWPPVSPLLPEPVYTMPAPSVTQEIGWSFHLVNIKWLLQGDVFVHKHKPAPPVYCSHGSNHLLNKQLLCLPAWVVCLFPVQGLGRTWRMPLCVSCGAGMWGFNGGISCRGRCACSYCIVTVVWRYALLICDSVEVADKITWLFGLTVKSPLAECHPCR